MWQRFTERARRVILLGQEEAGRMKSGHVGTEHLLLGLLRENEGVAAQILQGLGISLGAVRREIELKSEPGNEDASGEPKLTPKAKRVLELAADESRRMRHHHIGTEHLLLGLLREKDGLGATVLRRLGLDLAKARVEVLKYLDSDEAQDTPTAVAAKAEPRTLSPAAQIDWYIRQFVDNLNAGRAFPDNLKLVYGARLGYFGANEWADNWNREREEHQIRIEKIAVDLIEGEVAQATVSYRLGSLSQPQIAWDRGAGEQIWAEILTLGLVTEEDEQWWQIAPPDELQMPRNWTQPTLLAQAATALAQNGLFADAQSEAQRALIQLKRLSLAALQFTADWEDSFAFAPQYLEEALRPYYRAGQLFSISDREKYSFNENLCAKKLAQIAQPAQTVLFYEGEAKQLVFLYEGRAAVAFADGHCALVSQGEAQQLIWEVN